MKIVQLTTENVKRLKAVSIKPDGSLVQITGKNAQGKSSVLDSIAMAIGGKDMVCAKPVRKGESRARIECKFEDLVVTRTFTAEGGGTLTVTTGDGEKCPSPQALLDKMVGRLTLDPLEFMRLAPKKQAETLRILVGLDFAKLDEERAEKYAERTGVNAQGKTMAARFEGMTRHGDAPAEEVSVSELVSDLQAAERTNAAVTAQRRKVTDWDNGIASMGRKLEGIAEQIVRLQAEQKQVEADLAGAKESRAKDAAAAERMVGIETAPLQERIAGSEQINRKVRENAKRAELEKELQKQREKSKELTERLTEIDQQKADMLAAADFPVDGLAFDADGVTHNGVPLEQASSAEQLRVSVAIGLAMNPKLRVLLIRDGSLLDADGMTALGKLAEDSNCQIWVERVADEGDVGVVIEDGMVKGVGK